MSKKVILLIAILLICFGGAAFWAVRKVESIRAKRQYLASHSFRQDIKITIVEGKRREEIAQQMEKAGICSAADFLAASQNLEGYLFPDTYRFFPNTPAQEVVNTLYQNFQSKFPAGQMPSHDQVVLASIIEREAQNDTDRPLIAGVFANRLAINMKLESDVTVQYAKDSLAIANLTNLQGYIFWQPISLADTTLNSPFNTYVAPALPPSPIANPGKQSILAAMHPTQHQYFYFLYKNSQLMLSKTLAEHESKQ